MSTCFPLDIYIIEVSLVWSLYLLFFSVSRFMVTSYPSLL